MVSRFVLRSTWPTRLVHGRYRGSNKHVVYVLVYRKQIGNNNNNEMKYESKLETLAANRIRTSRAKTSRSPCRSPDCHICPSERSAENPAASPLLLRGWEVKPERLKARRLNRPKTDNPKGQAQGLMYDRSRYKLKGTTRTG